MRIHRGTLGVLLTLFLALPTGAQTNRAEMAAARDKAFPEADADHNGTLSSSEWEAFQQAMQRAIAAARFKRIDANGDGQVSREELDAAQGPRFKRAAAAANKNGAAPGAAAPAQPAGAAPPAKPAADAAAGGDS